MARPDGRRSRGAATMLTTVHPKPCRQCGKEFTPTRPLQAVCGPRCAVKQATAASKAKKAAERATTKARREALKTIADRIATAQKECNAYIRLRDMHQGCIDCGKPFEPQRPGGSMDAGHFRSRGAAPNLRFNEDNIFGQRKNCNRPGGATAADFRAGVVARIGEARVQAIESDNAPRKWTHAELIQIAATYKQKRKALEAA